MYIHNASAVLHHLYRLVTPLVDPVTRRTVVFLPHGPAAAQEVLARDGIGPEVCVCVFVCARVRACVRVCARSCLFGGVPVVPAAKTNLPSSIPCEAVHVDAHAAQN